MVKKYDKDYLSPCLKCNCMTKSIILGRANYKCGKCGADKSLSDVFFYEAIHKNDKVKPKMSSSQQKNGNKKSKTQGGQK